MGNKTMLTRQLHQCVTIVRVVTAQPGSCLSFLIFLPFSFPLSGLLFPPPISFPLPSSVSPLSSLLLRPSSLLLHSFFLFCHPLYLLLPRHLHLLFPFKPHLHPVHIAAQHRETTFHAPGFFLFLSTHHIAHHALRLLSAAEFPPCRHAWPQGAPQHHSPWCGHSSSSHGSRGFCRASPARGCFQRPGCQRSDCRRHACPG